MPTAPPPAWAPLGPGSLLGGTYRLIRLLARGGMGDVHLAYHERLCTLVVVKVPTLDLATDPDAFARFQHEAEVMMAAHHPNVVQIIDFNFMPSGLPYLVMEYLSGQDLADHMNAHPELGPAAILSIVRQVAWALDTAHQRGIVHRDLKPENIMLIPGPEGEVVVKLIDFGISKTVQSVGGTATTVIGTPEFMSPEQAQGHQDEVGARSDQFALAVITYLLMTGRSPWGTADPIQTLNQVVNHAPIPFVTSEETDGQWKPVEAVLLRALQKTPSLRFASVLDYAEALERAMPQVEPDTTTSWN